MSEDQQNFEQKYEQLLSDIYGVYKWIEECRDGGENIDNSDYRKGYLNRIENTLYKMEDWIDQIKSGEAEKAFAKMSHHCTCSATEAGSFGIVIHNICDLHLAEIVKAKAEFSQSTK